MKRNHSIRMPRRQFVLGSMAGALALSATGWAGRAHGQSAGKVVYGIGNLDTMFSAGFVALKNGYFKELGLDAEFIDCQNGPRARQMLAAGQIDICCSASFDPGVVSAAGKPTKVIAGIDRRLPYANVVVRKDLFDAGIKRFADLSGKRIGVSGPKSAFWLMATHMVEKAGLQGVDIRAIGGTPEMLAALKSGQVDASMATITMMDQAEKEGWGVPIVSINDDAGWTEAMGVGGDIPGQWIYALAETVAARPETMQAFVAGWMKGNDFIMSHTPEEVAELIHADYLSALPKETVAATVAILKSKVWSQDNIVEKDAYDRVMDVMAHDRLISDDAAGKLGYDDGADMSFARKARGA